MDTQTDALTQSDEALLADLFGSELLEPTGIEPALSADELLESDLDAALLTSPTVPEAPLSAESAVDNLLADLDLMTPTVEMAPVAEPEPKVTPEVEAPKKKGGKRGKKAEAAAEPEPTPPVAEPEMEKPAKEPKAPRATSITHKPGDLLMAKLGAKARDMLVFSFADAELEAGELALKQDAFVADMNDPDKIAIKVRDKAILLLTGLAAGAQMNDVLRRAFVVLHEEGKLTSGDKGNLQQNLALKPYSLGTCRAQANQVFMLFPILGICVKTKGGMTPNEDSTILAAAYAQLGLA